MKKYINYFFYFNKIKKQKITNKIFYDFSTRGTKITAKWYIFYSQFNNPKKKKITK